MATEAEIEAEIAACVERLRATTPLTTFDLGPAFSDLELAVSSGVTFAKVLIHRAEIGALSMAPDPTSPGEATIRMRVSLLVNERVDLARGMIAHAIEIGWKTP